MNEGRKEGMKENVISVKSYAFALRMVALDRYLRETHHEYVMSKQVLRSGTSICANIEEAQGAISKKEFIAKNQIAYKELRETIIWLRLMKDSGYMEDESFESIINDAKELLRILVSILKTSKNNENENNEKMQNEKE